MIDAMQCASMRSFLAGRTIAGAVVMNYERIEDNKFRNHTPLNDYAEPSSSVQLPPDRDAAALPHHS